MDWSEKICCRLIEDKIITTEDEEIIRYGVHQGLILGGNIITLLILCIGFRSLIEGILFLIVFWPLRIYGGGYHADSEKKCYLISTITEAIYLIVLKNICMNSIFIIILLLLNSTIILFFAPQDTKNKPLEVVEYAVYRKKVCIIIILQAIVCILCLQFKVQVICETIILSQSLMGILLIRGKVNNIFWKVINEKY